MERMVVQPAVTLLVLAEGTAEKDKGERERERERERRQRRKKNRGGDWFFSDFGPDFLLPQAINSASIYSRWKRVISSAPG